MINSKEAHVSTSLGLGEVNGHLIGIVMKEMVRRAITTIRSKRMAFEVMSKEGYGGTMDDVFTSADSAAQEIYLRTITEGLPDVGVIAEEDHLRINNKNGCTAYFTIDPLDGTRAFVRRQSHGVGTMIALVLNNEVVSAYIGDINTNEIFGFRPGSHKVHRISEFNISEVLGYEKKTLLGEHYILLRDPERKQSPAVQAIAEHVFKNVLVDGGSIGTWLARLWKREVGAAIIDPDWETPWDSTPIIGISKKLGYKFLRPNAEGAWELYEPVLSMEKYYRDHDILIVHEQDVVDLGMYLAV